MPLPPKHAYHTADEYPITVAMTDAVGESNLFHGDQKDAGDIERQQQRAHDRIEKMSFVRDFPAGTLTAVERMACSMEPSVNSSKFRVRRYIARCRAAAALAQSQEAVDHMFYGGTSPFGPVTVREKTAVVENWMRTFDRLMRLKTIIAEVPALQQQVADFGNTLNNFAEGESPSQVWEAVDSVNKEAAIVFKDIKKVVAAFKDQSAYTDRNLQHMVTASAEDLHFAPIYVNRRLQDLKAVLGEASEVLEAMATHQHLDSKLRARRGSTELTDTAWLDNVFQTKTAAPTDVSGGVAGQQTQPGQSMGLAIGDRVQDQEGSVGQVQEVGVDGKINVKYDTGPMPAATYGPDAMTKGIIRRAVGEDQDGDLDTESIFGDAPQNQGVTSFTQGASKRK